MFVTLRVSSSLDPSVMLRGVCVRLDGASVLLTDAAEIATGKSAERDVRVAAGSHTLDVVGEWVEPISSGVHSGASTFVAQSTHAFDIAHVSEIGLTFERDEKTKHIQARWNDDPRLR